MKRAVFLIWALLQLIETLTRKKTQIDKREFR